MDLSLIRELIKDKFGVKLSDVSVGRLLRKLGLSPQRLLRKVYQRDSEKVKERQEVAYPEIRKGAKKAGATLYFGDEASVRSYHHSESHGLPWVRRQLLKKRRAIWRQYDLAI